MKASNIACIDNEFWTSLYANSQVQKIDKQALNAIELNADLSISAQVDIGKSPWVASPAPGVTRVMAERDGGEKTTRASSLVAYRADSHFSSHVHPKGEEFIVLSGVFSDEHGDYPAGSYVRNPPGSSHSPFSTDGCLIFVKLQQFNLEDDQHVVVSMENVPAIRHDDCDRRVLFDQYECVELLSFSVEAALPKDLGSQGLELLVLNGQLRCEGRHFGVGCWLRFPAGDVAREVIESIRVAKGSHLFIKSRHLP